MPPGSHTTPSLLCGVIKAWIPMGPHFVPVARWAFLKAGYPEIPSQNSISDLTTLRTTPGSPNFQGSCPQAKEGP